MMSFVEFGTVRKLLLTFLLSMIWSQAAAPAGAGTPGPLSPPEYWWITAVAPQSSDQDRKKIEAEKKKADKENKKAAKNTEKKEKQEVRARRAYEQALTEARLKLEQNQSFKARVDDDFKEIRRQHSEIGFHINTYDSNDERVTFTGDKLKTEDTLYDNPLVQDYVNRVGQSLVPAQSQIRYAFKVILNPVPDARAYSTGTIYITSGLLSMVDNEAQLAYILGHEIGHNELRHWYNDALVSNQLIDEAQARERNSKIIGGVAALATAGMVKLGGGSLTDSLVAAQLAGGLARTLSKLLSPRKVFDWDELQENEADNFGFQQMFSRNYDPREVPKLFNRMRRFADGDPRISDGFLAQIERLGERTAYVNSLIGGSVVKPNLFRGASNLRSRRETTDGGLVSPLEAGKAFGSNDDAASREAKALQNMAVSEALLKEKLARGELVGSGPEFESVMADLKRDNGIRAFYYDMYNLALENLREALQLRSNDAYTHYYYGKVLGLTAHTPDDRARSMESFVRAIELDQRRVISGPWLHRALSLMADHNPGQNEEVIGYLKSYVEVYQQEHGGELPPNMDAIYAYLKDLGDQEWVARPVVNISTRNIDPIRIVSTSEVRGGRPAPSPAPSPSPSSGSSTGAAAGQSSGGLCANCSETGPPKPAPTPAPKPRTNPKTSRRSIN
ncbi:MAG: hypothetical protein EBZ36_07380 [Acidobacteria bacterium]|nr:hypothetical protein [Acidobacteriota bacterium]